MGLLDRLRRKRTNSPYDGLTGGENTTDKRRRFRLDRLDKRIEIAKHRKVSFVSMAIIAVMVFLIIYGPKVLMLFK